MNELEKLKAAKEVRLRWDTPSQSQNYNDWLDAEIARLEDPHAEAKQAVEYLRGYADHNVAEHKVVQYVGHLTAELAHYKIQYQHAKEAAAEPLDPKRVLATAATIIGEPFGSYFSLANSSAKPYKVQK